MELRNCHANENPRALEFHSTCYRQNAAKLAIGLAIPAKKPMDLLRLGFSLPRLLRRARACRDATDRTVRAQRKTSDRICRRARQRIHCMVHRGGRWPHSRALVHGGGLAWQVVLS